MEKEVSEEAAKSIPRADDDDDEAPAPAEETSEAAAVEAAAAEDKPQPPAKKPRSRKKADETRRRPRTRSRPSPSPPASATSRASASRARRPCSSSAKARYVRTSARKARLVCDHIRGKDVEQARAILSFTPRGAAKPWMKLLESAIANAEHNHELVGDELKIASVHADEGPTLKRYRPRAMGRATRIRKRTSHLSITLTPKE